MPASTIDYATPHQRYRPWVRIASFFVLIPISAALGSAIAFLHGWGWDFHRPVEDWEVTSAGIGCATFTTMLLAVPAGFFAGSLRGRNAIVVYVLAASMATAGGYAIGRQLLTLLYA